jgi:hypothetical protein
MVTTLGTQSSTATDSQLRVLGSPPRQSDRQPSSSRAGIPAPSDIKGTPVTFVGTVDNAPDEQTAIARAIEEYDVPPNKRGMMRRRD